MAKLFLTIDDVKSALSEILAALSNLNFKDNFKGFEWTGSIAANTEVLIDNKLSPKIPSGFVVTDLRSSPTLVRGVAAWTDKKLSLKNTSATTALTATVFFYR